MGPPPDVVDERLRRAADDARAVPRRTLILPRLPVDEVATHRRRRARTARTVLVALGVAAAGFAAVAALRSARR